MDSSQEAAHLNKSLREAKYKWVQLHDIITDVTERESAIMSQVNNLEDDLRVRTEEARVAGEGKAKMEERLLKVMEQNRLHSSTNVIFDARDSVMKAENEELQAKVKKLRARLQNQEDSFIFEKTYSMFHMKRKTLEEAKA